MNIFGLLEDPEKEFLPTATLSAESDSSTTSPVWFSSYGKSVELYLVLFKPYMNLKVKVSLRPSTCEVITVQPCFNVEVTEKRFKEYNISIETIHFSEKIPTDLSSDWLVNKYFSYHYEKACKLPRQKYGKRKYKHTLSFIFRINLQKASCLALQILPASSNFTVNTVSMYLNKNIWLYTKRTQIICQYYFVIENQPESFPHGMSFQGYFMSTFAEKDGSKTNILSNNGAMKRSVARKEGVFSFYMNGELAMINLLMDMDYFSSLFALMAQEGETITSEHFTLQMSRIKEQSHELMILFQSILSVNILKTNDNNINQCKKIDIKILSPTNANDEICVDAFVSLKFYHGDLMMPSERTVTKLREFDEKYYCRFVDFVCVFPWEYAFEVWYRISCNGSRSLSFVVDSKVSYEVGDEKLVFPRNTEFEILHEINYEDIYAESSDHLGLTITDTTDCFNPIINFAQKGRTNNISFKERQYFLFNSDDDFRLNFWNLFSRIFEKYSQISWNQAAYFCESRGLHLLTIGDVEEERAALSLLLQKSPQRADTSISVFLGLITRKEVSFTFVVYHSMLKNYGLIVGQIHLLYVL